MKLTILMDNPNSWYYPYAEKLVNTMSKNYEVHFVHSAADVPEGDILFLMSCEKILRKDIRDRNKHNIVVHSSELPRGKGWSPLSWSILEGKNRIVNTLFEAVDAVDAGMIYLQNTMNFEGHELLSELHDIQGKMSNTLILDFINQYPDIISRGRTQVGDESFYKRRGEETSKLDPGKSIIEQFSLLRIVDNERYPAFFYHNNKKYIIKIYKAD